MNTIDTTQAPLPVNPEREAYEAQLAEIEADMASVTERQVKVLGKALNDCQFSFTATTLAALALWDDANCSEDGKETEGGKMLRRFAAEFAAYEARVV